MTPARSGAGPRDALRTILSAALAAVDPRAAVRRNLGFAGDGRFAIAGAAIPETAALHVLALGKAAVPMAAAVEEVARDRIASGLVVTKDGHGGGLGVLPVRTAGHPVPDSRSEEAAAAALRVARDAAPGDVLLVLLSGGTSALCFLPAPGLRGADVVAATEALLRGGFDIAETNTVRKHITAFAGGRLALAARCGRIEVLAISDVQGDAIDVIGSGPCAPDPTTYAMALDVLKRRPSAADGLARVIAHLERGRRGEIEETPKDGDPRLAGVRHTIVARNADAIAGAAEAALALGYDPVELGTVLRGEARDAARGLVALARGAPRIAGARERCFIAGGETTVTVRGRGRGGRNQELALAAALVLDGSDRGLTVLAAGTDGIDGPTDAAGAFADAGTVARGAAAGASAERALAENDAYGFFEREGGLLVTGPTGTNVMDLALLLEEAPG